MASFLNEKLRDAFLTYVECYNFGEAVQVIEDACEREARICERNEYPKGADSWRDIADNLLAMRRGD